MGRVFVIELDGRSYGCKFCNTPLALANHILSRVPLCCVCRSCPVAVSNFNCSQGRAYLFSKVVNVTLGPQVDRMMMSGLHTVEDIFCCCCGQILGWKYVLAHEKNEIYKEGKFVLERWTIVDSVEDEDLNSDVQGGSQAGSSDTENA